MVAPPPNCWFTFAPVIKLATAILWLDIEIRLYFRSHCFFLTSANITFSKPFRNLNLYLLWRLTSSEDTQRWLFIVASIDLRNCLPQIQCSCLRTETLSKKRLRNKCFLVNFAKFFGTLFLQKTSGDCF